VGLTIWLAPLFRNGTVFLQDVFTGAPGLAEAVNHLLVVGFYMLSLGYGLYILRATNGMDGLKRRSSWSTGWRCWSACRHPLRERFRVLADPRAPRATRPADAGHRNGRHPAGTDRHGVVRLMARTKLTVLYDEQCAFCRRCRTGWPPSQSWWRSSSCSARRPHRRVRDTPIGKELVVVDDDRNAWVGPSAFLMCLWATAKYRSWAFRFTEPGYEQFMEQSFAHLEAPQFVRRMAREVRSRLPYCDDVQTRRGFL
jgi:hypothetical protein